MITSLDELRQRLATPSERLVGDLEEIDGDLLILGAGGKMGPSLARERIFEYFSRRLDIPVVLMRLNYAIDLRTDDLHGPLFSRIYSWIGS